MNLPRPEWYSIEELAIVWGTDKEQVERYIHTGQLICSSRYFNPTSHDEIWRRDTRQLPCTDRENLARSIGYEYDGEYIKLEDVEQFESTCQIEPKRSPPINNTGNKSGEIASISANNINDPVVGAKDLARLFNDNVRRKKKYSEKQVVQILRDRDILPPSQGRSNRRPLVAERALVIQCAKDHKK